MARAGATWPGTWPNCRRARGSLGEGRSLQGPAPSPPLKGDAPSVAPVRRAGSGTPSAGPRPLPNFPLPVSGFPSGASYFL